MGMGSPVTCRGYLARSSRLPLGEVVSLPVGALDRSLQGSSWLG